MSWTPKYPINFAPPPGGDTTSTAIEKFMNEITNVIFPLLNRVRTLDAGETPPVDPVEHAFWIDTSGGKLVLKMYNGVEWTSNISLVLSMDNMVEGTDAKIMTSAERDKLISLDGAVNDLENVVNILHSTLNNRTWDVIIEDRKSAGTDGGTFTSGSWITRTLNTLVYNNDSLASLSSNRFSLPAGTYCIDWDAPACRVSHHQTRLFNYTDSKVEAYGTSETIVNLGSLSGRSFGTATVTIPGQKSFRIEHRCSTTIENNGLGYASGFGTEVYTRVRIKKMV